MNLIKQLPFLNVQGYILTNSNKYMEPRAIRKYYNNFLLKLDIENPIIRINTAFKGCSSLEKISVLPRIYHN